MAHWLVTGGAGFIGSHLVEALLARGDAVEVLDDLSTGRLGSLPQAARLREGDLLDDDLLAQALQGARGIFHLAAAVSVEQSVREVVRSHHLNATGTVKVLDAARRAGNLPVVLASSAAVYGDQGGRPCSEDLLPLPLSPYAADKLAGEHHARAAWAVHRLPSASLRFFNVYGARQDPRSPYAGVVARFANNVRRGRPHLVLGDGGQTRDFIHVGDVVRALLAAQDLLARSPQAALCNVCTGRSVSLLELAAAFDRLRPDAAPPLVHGPARDGDIRHSCGTTDRMRALLGIEATTSLDEGLPGLLA